MAEAYLNDGATSLAAANWSDATGFAAAAQLVIGSGSQSIVTALDQSAVSIEYLDILPPFTGNIGSATAGSLITDVDGTAENAATLVSRLRYWAGGGSLFFNAGGGNTLAHHVDIDTGGFFNGTSGIMKNVRLSKGTANFASNVSATSGLWEFTGGASTIQYHATNNIPELRITGGSHNLLRAATTLVVGGGSVTLDCQGVALTTVVLYSGTLRILNCGTITLLQAYSGVLDFSGLSRNLTITTGKGAGSDALQVRRNKKLTVSTFQPIGGGTTWA